MTRMAPGRQSASRAESSYYSRGANGLDINGTRRPSPQNLI